MLPALNKFFEPVSIEFFRLFSKQFSHSSLNFFNTCEMNYFEMILESSKQPEVRGCQIKAVGCRTSLSLMLSPLKWQYKCGVWLYHVEEALVLLPSGCD
jgi:hypothetical protein